MHRHMVALATAVLATLLLVGFSAPTAAGDIYRPGSTGYDVSYPQCHQPAPGNDFAILGVNHGRPFRYNGCLRREYDAAPKAWPPSLYMNTGYDLYYNRWLTSDCAGRSEAVQGSPEQRHAWAIGCSEASTAAEFVKSQGVPSPSMWWLDVESDNSWSSDNVDLNRYTIQGAVDLLYSSGHTVGIYSNAQWWSSITGGAYNPSGVTADWVGTVKKRSVSSFCGLGFSYVPVWLVQYIEDAYDRNYACLLK